MSEYNKTILTNEGLALVAKANKGTAKFTITRAATSAEKLADKSIAELQQLTELPTLMQYGVINDVTDAAQDSSIVIGTELVFNNKDLTNSYNINCVGLYAKEEGSRKEVLYALTTAINPETMPDYKNKVMFKFSMTMFVVIGQADNVTVNVVENGVVTHKQLAEAIAALPSKTDITNLYNKIENDARTLVALNSPNGNNIYNSKINLDIYGTLGVTKFLGCELQTTGRMDGFNKDATNLYGWIINVSKWNGAEQYEQTIYICDYGEGSQIFVRSKANASGKNKEDFEKIATDSDLLRLEKTLQKAIDKAGQVKQISINKGVPVSPDANGLADLDLSMFVKSLGGAKPDNNGDVPLVSKYYSNEEIDPNKFVTPGIYKLRDCSCHIASLPKFSGNLTGYLLVIQSPFIKDELYQYLFMAPIYQLYIYCRVINPSVDKLTDFQRLLDNSDYTTLWNKITAVENKELVHQCDDLATGMTYSKDHPNVFVATP